MTLHRLASLSTHLLLSTSLAVGAAGAAEAAPAVPQT